MWIIDRLPDPLKFEVLKYFDAAELDAVREATPSLNLWPVSPNYIRLLYNRLMEIDWLNGTLYGMLSPALNTTDDIFEVFHYYREKNSFVNKHIRELRHDKINFTFALLCNGAIDCTVYTKIFRTLSNLSGRDMSNSTFNILENIETRNIFTLADFFKIVVDTHSLKSWTDGDAYAIKKASELTRYDCLLFLIKSWDEINAWDNTQKQFGIINKIVNKAPLHSQPLLIVVNINNAADCVGEFSAQHPNFLPNIVNRLNHDFFCNSKDADAKSPDRRIWHLREENGIYANFSEVIQWAVTEIVDSVFKSKEQVVNPTDT